MNGEIKWIIGTGLAALRGDNGSILGGSNGILGGGGNDVTQREATVGIIRYFEDRIIDRERAANMFNDLQMQICSLRERAAVGETSTAYQNILNSQAFGFIDTRFTTERMITDYELAAGLCRKIDGQLYLSPNHLASAFKGHTQVLESYTAREDLPGRGHGNNCGCGPNYGGF